MEKESRIIEAADRLAAQGKPVTVASVREELGGGSYSTIGPVLQKRSAKKNTSSQFPTAPDELTSRMLSYTSELWCLACQIADERLERDRSRLEGQIDNLRETQKEANSAADTAITEKESAMVRIKELEAAFATAKDNLDAACKRATEFEIRHQEAELRINDLKSQIERLERQNTNLTAKNDDLTTLCGIKAAAAKTKFSPDEEQRTKDAVAKMKVKTVQKMPKN
jgi:chromosome segregation ATPase